MNAINKAILAQMTGARPVLSKTTALKFDDEFNAAVDALIEAAKHDDAVGTVAFAETIRAWADVITGYTRLGVPFAADLWEDWTQRLLWLETKLAEVNTPAARRSFNLLLTLCVVAHHFQATGEAQ